MSFAIRSLVGRDVKLKGFAEKGGKFISRAQIVCVETWRMARESEMCVLIWQSDKAICESRLEILGVLLHFSSLSVQAATAETLEMMIYLTI